MGEKRWVGRERERERKGQEGELLIFRPREKREARSKEEVVVDDWWGFFSLLLLPLLHPQFHVEPKEMFAVHLSLNYILVPYYILRLQPVLLPGGGGWTG